MEKEIYQIIIGLVVVMVGLGGIFGWLVVRLIRGYDEQIKELFTRTADLPAIRESIKWFEKIADRCNK